MNSTTFSLLAFLLFMPIHGQAHHSGSNYDRTVRTTLQGTIVRYDWSNPHVYLWVEVESDSGTSEIWEIEGYPPAIHKRLGWSKDEVAIGEHVTVGGSPGRDPEKRILVMTSLEKAGEPEFSMRPLHIMTSLTQDETVGLRASGLDGTWVTLLNTAAFRPRTLALTEKGREAIANYVEEAESPALECVPFPSPALMMAPDIKSIEVSEDKVTIRGEFDGSERTVYLDQASHDEAAESIQGHSIGRWEGRALVIDTTHFAPQRAMMVGFGLPSGPGKHLIERLELNEDGTHLTYSFELEDPEYLESPAKAEDMQWVYRPDIEFEALPCDLDNARRFLE